MRRRLRRSSRQHGIKRDSIDVIGFHGQTVLHRPADRLTVQLGLGDVLADLTRCTVVYDLRAADVAAGGQGAPLVPVYHQALTARLPQRPLADASISAALPTSPGSAAMDRLDRIRYRARQRADRRLDDEACAGRAFDVDGATAARGQVHEDVVRFYLNHSFFASTPPKSLDRNAFFSDLVEGLSVEDGAATLAAFTAGAIAKAREHMPEEPALWIIAGGGRRNQGDHAADCGAALKMPSCRQRRRA